MRCASCGADCTPFTFTNGYTIAFDELRSRRRHRAARGGRGLRPRGGPLRGAARQLRPEPDPRLRAARHRRAGHAAAPVPGPDRDVAVDDDPRLPQRGRLRLVPGRGAAPLRARRAGAPAPQDRRAHGHRRGARGRDPRLPGEARRRRRLPRRHARAAGRRRDRGPHLRRVGHRHAAGRGPEGPRQRRPDPVPGGGGPAVPGPAAQPTPSASGPWRSPAGTASTRSRSRCRSRSSARAPTSTRPPTTGSRGRRSCSTCRSPR